MLEIGGELDLGEEPFCPDDGGQLGPHELEGDPAVVAEVVREVDRGHSSGPDLALDPIPIRERALKAAEEFGRGCLRL